MNDLNYFVGNTSLRLYADDTTSYASNTSLVVLKYIKNSDLQVVREWLQNNHLLAEEQYEDMIFNARMRIEKNMNICY